jgi:hypothetical protein
VHDDVGPVAQGLARYGVASVLSTTSGMWCSWATDDTPSKSSTSPLGLPSVSAKKALVLGRTAARQASRSSGSSTKVTSIPSLGSV